MPSCNGTIVLLIPQTIKMKPTKLLFYAAAGMIAGLLIENKTLIIKECAAAKGRMLKKKVKNAIGG